MKKTVSLILCVLILAAFGGCEKVTEFTSGEYEYHLNDDGTAKLTAYHGTATELTLPFQLDGHALTSIDKRDKLMNEDFVSVISLVIPEGYTRIGSSTFKSCTKLTSATLPDTLTRIDDSAFAGCESLGEITLPQGLELIGSGVFADTALETVSIPDAATWNPRDIFGGNPFANCKRLREFIVSDQHPTLLWKDGVLLSRDETMLMVYPAARKEASYTAPETVTSIGRSAFSGAPLRTVTLPEALTAVTEGAFWCCAALETVILPAGLKEISDSAFYGCGALKNVQLPDGLHQMGDRAFAKCTALETLAIPQSVTMIGKNCFEGCDALTLEITPGFPAEAYAKENEISYRYPAAYTPQAPAETLPASVNTAVPPQTAAVRPDNTGAPTPTGMPSLDWPPVPGENETVYVGEGRVSQAKKVEIGFILSADQKSIHDLTIRLENLSIEIPYEGGRTTLTGGTVMNKSMGVVTLSGIATNISLGETKITDLILVGDTAVCTLQYVYHYNGSDSGAPATDVPFDLTAITLHRQ